MINKSGQTLIETLVAMGILTIGVVSLIALLISVENTANNALAQTRAMQLAQEVIEAARFVRDSNWLKYEDGNTAVNYYDGLRDTTVVPPNYTAIYTWDPTITSPDNAIVFNFTPNFITDATTVVYKDNTGFNYYRQALTPPNTWASTTFRRFITFNPICFNPTVSSNKETIVSSGTCVSANSNNVEIGIDVVVQMQWQVSGKVHNYYVEEKLYNWKYANVTAQ